MNYLGYTIDQSGAAPNREKVQAILQIFAPKTVREVKSFLGVINYYRSHIPNCVQLAEPLHQLTRDNNKFQWAEVEMKSFENLKKELANFIVNNHPKFDCEFHIWTDASVKGIGGFIAQYDDENVLKPITFISRLIKRAEKNYTTYELELLAIIHILKKYSFLLLGYKVKIYTDHQAITYLKYYNLPNLRLSRWYVFMNFFDLEFFHIAGHKNVVADALSRFRGED